MSEHIRIVNAEPAQVIRIVNSEPAQVVRVINFPDGGERKTSRSDFVAPYSYIGSALYGISEASAFWTITRIEVAADGSVTTATALNVKWTERLTIF